MGIFTNEKIDESLISVAVNKEEKQLIRNVYCHNLNTEDMKKLFCDIMSDREVSNACKAVMFLNINAFYIAQKSNPYCRALNKADFMLNDGVGIDKLARSYGVEFKENMNGTDLIPKMIRWMADIHGDMDFVDDPEAEGGIYLLGTIEQNVQDAADDFGTAQEIPIEIVAPTCQTICVVRRFFAVDVEADVVVAKNFAESEK